MMKACFLAGTKQLESKKDWINELNVFPVPDGDTGTNMTLTLMNAVNSLTALDESASMDEVGKIISQGTLRGARGNSGVILSQLVRGFVKEIEGKEELDQQTIARGLERAVN
ncbi:MAG: DAK2 domain-containing protein, partial [Parasporobacterium sp.]|nr:DAK2 domain-containing protein [Parasporobacterium sp.]